MKTKIAALAILLMAGGAPVALAQSEPGGHHERQDQTGGERRPHDLELRPAEQRMWRPQGPLQPLQPPEPPQARTAPPAPQAPSPGDRGRGGPQVGPHDWPQNGSTGGPPPGDHPRWTPGPYPHVFWSFHRFHTWPYHAPPGFYVRSWTYGEILPEAWFAQQYLIEDWWDYDLPEPPDGLDWVRVGVDAVLIDEDSGRIIQVVRGLFW